MNQILSLDIRFESASEKVHIKCIYQEVSLKITYFHIVLSCSLLVTHLAQAFLIGIYFRQISNALDMLQRLSRHRHLLSL